MQDFREETKKVSDQELQKLYDSGPETTINFIKILLDKIQRFEIVLKRQDEEIQKLKEQIAKNGRVVKSGMKVLP